MQACGGEPLTPLLPTALGINCNICLISSLLKRMKKKWKRNLLLKEAQENPKSAAFSFISYRRGSCVVMWFLTLPPSSAVSMVSLFACSTYCRRKARLFGYLCLFIFVFFILNDFISSLWYRSIKMSFFLSLFFVIFPTAFKERHRCLWGETVGWKRKG